MALAHHQSNTAPFPCCNAPRPRLVARVSLTHGSAVTDDFADPIATPFGDERGQQSLLHGAGVVHFLTM